MKLAIIGAMDIEINFLVTQLTDKKVDTINNFTFFSGNLLHHEVVIVKSGIGKVMSGLLLSTLMHNFRNLDKIINVGVAGGLVPLEIADIVVGSNYLYGDVDLTGIDDVPYGQMANFPLLYPGDNTLIANIKDVHFGIICTTDKFIARLEDAQEIINKFPKDFPILCFDMESTAFAQSCYHFHIPFLAIRAISDIIGSQKQEHTFYSNVEKASIKSNEFILQLLKNLN